VQVALVFDSNFRLVHYLTQKHDLALLQHLHSTGPIPDSFTHAASLGVDHQTLVGLLKSLAADGLVELAPLSTTLLALTEEGESVVSQGSPEWRLFDAVPESGDGISQEELIGKLGKEVVKVSL
jgi:phenylalanyl-tRNA synthetase alpha chain